MTAISTNQLTDKSPSGSGVFDTLMGSVKSHLEQEYKQGRISGTDYSNVYLGAMTAAMQQSVAFLLAQEKAGFEADLVAQQVTNAAKEHEVLHAQKCKLDAEFDVLVAQKPKVDSEKALLDQKLLTEQAQISGVGVDADSVIGKQKELYTQQASGFIRDAEQKAAKLMMDSWNVQRTTDPDVTAANATNKLDDTHIGQAVTKLLAGIGA